MEREVVKEVPVAVESIVVKREAVAMPVTSSLMPATTVTSTTARPRPISPNTSLVMSRGATISGAVIDEETGLPIVDVSIEAQSVVDGGPNSYASTDADGRYELRGIAPGSYLIKAWTNSQNYIQELYGDAFNWDDASLVTVRGTEPVEGINFDLIRGSTISGVVLDSETGLPIADVEIETQSVAGPYSHASTGADGRYTLRGIAPGSYRIRAWADSQNYIQVLYGDTFSSDDAKLVTVRGTEPVEGVNFDLSLGAVLSGRVIDATTGLPISKIGVSAGPADEGHLSWTETDGNGNYSLRGLPDGVVEVFVDGEGYIQDRTWVRVGPAEAVKGVDFDLTFGATISGRVTDEDTGLPIPNVWVNADQKNWDGPSSGANTDADGRFKIRGVAPGTYVLKADGDWEGYIREVYNNTRSRDDADLVVVRGTEPVYGIEFSLKRGASISGQIVDESGHPIPNLDVSAGPMYGDHLSWSRTDGNGVYVLRGLPDGVIEIFVNGEDYIEGRMTVTIREGTDIAGLDF